MTEPCPGCEFGIIGAHNCTPEPSPVREPGDIVCERCDSWHQPGACMFDKKPSPIREQLKRIAQRSENSRVQESHIRADAKVAANVAEWLLDGIEEAHQLTRHHKELWACRAIDQIDKRLERLLKGRHD